jgi:phosphatidylserine/phosphatidylglycerophosphate/cardiolipin synthase-like enzyme
LSRSDAFHASGGESGDTLAVRFLEEGGQDEIQVAGWMAEFIDGARQTLDLAIYDCRLTARPAALLRDVLNDRIAAGVRVRLVYDAGGKPQSPSGLDANGADYAPLGTSDRVRELGLADELTRGVTDFRGLMHHKYLVRDGQSVWTGSLNLTDDSMSRMENLIVLLSSQPLAAFYTRDFEQLWDSGKIGVSGAFQTDPAMLRYDGEQAPTDVDFSPGQGEQINEWVAAKVMQARRRIVLCSMLLNSSKLLNALTGQLDRGGIELWGVYDGTQMEGVLDQWRERDDLAWKIAAVRRVVDEGRLAGKRSHPYRPGEVHDFMHNKTLVVDDTVITGSYNLSHAAQANAENMLAIDSPALAERVVAYTRHLSDRYGRQDADALPPDDTRSATSAARTRLPPQTPPRVPVPTRRRCTRSVRTSGR